MLLWLIVYCNSKNSLCFMKNSPLEKKSKFQKFHKSMKFIVCYYNVQFMFCHSHKQDAAGDSKVHLKLLLSVFHIKVFVLWNLFCSFLTEYHINSHCF